MPILLDNGDEGVRMVLDEALTIYNVAEHHAALQTVLAEPRPLTIDLSPVEELDTAGVQLLIWLKRQRAKSQRSCHFDHHSEAVCEVLAVLHAHAPLDAPLNREPA